MEISVKRYEDFSTTSGSIFAARLAGMAEARAAIPSRSTATARYDHGSTGDHASDDDDSSMHADVALVVARLLNESVTRLALVRTRVEQLEAAIKESAEGPASPPHQVREARATYLC